MISRARSGVVLTRAASTDGKSSCADADGTASPTKKSAKTTASAPRRDRADTGELNK
jgi:hypothetical protein